MSMANDMRKGTKGGGDSTPRDIFQAMNQGGMGRCRCTHGLFESMHQGSMKGTPGRLRPGKSAPSVAKSMGQGGR